ncbi:MAG: hypothetical protein J0J01_16015 [Reyranella sp.]|uniref:hypothetical protein n=1 Tax=Reyranella sp. TaxID=1929291 RepID=UPI001ACCB1A6|nr:hypothetical protein [Reyranella sp.]MBN9088412.1 hypothetical protein [Reyranella sp.]
MTRRSTLLALLLLGPLAACEKKEEGMPPATVDQPVDPAQEEKRLRRPPPASSGIGSDPDNPSGAPGSGRIGTSPSRY